MNTTIAPQAQTVSVDYKHLNQFLNFMATSSVPELIWCGDDDKDRKAGHRQFLLTRGERSHDIENAQGQGWGVFYAVNQTDGSGRRAVANITSIRAVHADIDTAGEQRIDWPLAPSVVVCSSPGKFHYYWLVNGMPVDVARSVNERFVVDYGADKAAKDISRVLRLPGTWNLKPGRAPHRVTCVGGNGVRYSADRVLAAFPPAEVPMRKRVVDRTAPGGEVHWANNMPNFVEEMRSALFLLPHDKFIARERWVEVGMALHQHFGAGSEAGFNMFDDWSHQFPNYGGTDSVWASFKPHSSGGVTGASIFHHAAEAGWKNPRKREAPSVPPPPPPPPTVTGPLSVVSGFDSLATPEVTPIWALDQWVLGDNVTLVAGDGGGGKSLAIMQMLAYMSEGVQFMGLATRKGPTFYISAEDERDEVNRRMKAIYKNMPFCDFKDFHTLCIDEMEEPAIYAMGPTGKPGPTALFAQILEIIERLRPVCIAIDPLADLFAGDEISRAEVRGFISHLRKIARKYSCAVIMIGHPSVDGMKSKRGYSGSTAWNNSVRSRITFERSEEEGEENVRIMTLAKTNRSKVGEVLRMEWRNGSFVSTTMGSEKKGPKLKFPEFNTAFDTVFAKNKRQCGSYFGVDQMEMKDEFMAIHSADNYEAKRRQWDRAKKYHIEEKKHYLCRESVIYINAAIKLDSSKKPCPT